MNDQVAAIFSLFLYLLIIAVVMVVLAVIQIYRGTDVRTQLPGSPPVLGRSL